MTDHVMSGPVARDSELVFQLTTVCLFLCAELKRCGDLPDQQGLAIRDSLHRCRTVCLHRAESAERPVEPGDLWRAAVALEYNPDTTDNLADLMGLAYMLFGEWPKRVMDSAEPLTGNEWMVLAEYFRLGLQFLDSGAVVSGLGRHAG